MTKDIDNGGGAFPIATVDGFSHDGMTLRDWFAGQALAGIATASGYQGLPWGRVAVEAYSSADAMLAERSKDGASS